VGAELPGGVKIYKILPDSVIFQHNGKLEKVTIKRAPKLNFNQKPQPLRFNNE